MAIIAAGIQPASGRDALKRQTSESILRVSLALVFLGAAGCQSAQGWEHAPFAAAELTYGFEDFDLSDAEDASGLELDADSSYGLGLRAGTFLQPNVAVEVQGQLFDAFDIDVPGQSAAEVDVWAATVNLKVYTDLTARYHVYGLLGLGAMSADLDDSRNFFADLDAISVAGRAGMGLEGRLGWPLYWFVEAAVLEPFDDLDGLRVLTLTGGLGWRIE